MATLTTSDIKTIDELPEISGDSLTGQDCFLAFDKNSNSHKKIQATAFKAWVTSSAGEAAASARAAAASAANAAASEQAASGSATSAGASATAADGSATLSQSWAVGGTGTRTGEDTNNSRYYAQQSAASATSAAGSSADAADSLAEVRSALATGGITEGHRTVVVAADMASLADVDTTFRIRGNATLTVRDSPVFSTRITIINETNSPQVVSLTLSGGSGTRVIAAGQSWKYVWTGYWNDGLGIAPAVTANDPRPVASGAVSSRITVLETKTRTAVIPDGWAIDDMHNQGSEGTWYIPAARGGVKPLILGSQVDFDAILEVRVYSNGVATQKMYSANNPERWSCSRTWGGSGWISAGGYAYDGGYTQGGWIADYKSVSYDVLAQSIMNGVGCYISFIPGKIQLRLSGNENALAANVQFVFANRDAIARAFYNCSMYPFNELMFAWQSGSQLGGVVIPADFQGLPSYWYRSPVDVPVGGLYEIIHSSSFCMLSNYGRA